MNNKTKYYGVVVVAVVSCALLAICGTIFSFLQVNSNRFPKRMFDDLSQFKAAYDGYSIIDETADNDLGILVPTDSWCAEVEFDGKDYKVFAYEFADAEDAFVYFKNVSGQKDAPQQICFFHQSTSMGKTKCVVYYHEYAYKVTGGKLNDFAKFINHLCSNFPIDVSEEYHNEYGIWLK